MTGTRYKKDKAKTPRGYSNPRSSRDNKLEKTDRKHIELALTKPLEMFEKKPRKVSKQ
jgi:hypothetical protein